MECKKLKPRKTQIKEYMLYILIIVLLICLIYHYDYQEHKFGRKEWYIVCAIIFILVAGLKYRLGTDTVVYEQEYPEMPDLWSYFSLNFENEKYGRGFLLLAAIARSISKDFVSLQLLHAVFVISVVFCFFYKNTHHPFFAILLFAIICYFPLMFEAIREACAVCMLLIGWKYFLKDQWLKYYLCAIIAIFFHISGSIMLVLPIFYLPVFRIFFKMGKGFIITVVMVFAICFFLSVKFFDLIRLLEIADVDNYAAEYENGSYSGSTSLSLIGMAAFFIKNLLYPVIAIGILKGNLKNKTHVYMSQNYIDKLEYMFCWSVYIAIMTLFIKLFYRFNNYFYIFAILTIADAVFERVRLISKRKIKLSFAMWMIIILPYLSITFSRMFSNDGGSGVMFIRRYYPYESVLDPVKDKERERLYKFYDR